MEAEDYPFCLDCFVRTSPGDDDSPARQSGFNTLVEAVSAAERLIKGGRFKYLELYRWEGDDWNVIRTWPE